MQSQCRTVARSAAILLRRAPRPVLSYSAAFHHKRRSIGCAGGGAGSPPRKSLAGKDDGGGPGRNFRGFKLLAAISLLCCLLKKPLHLEKFFPLATSAVSAQANRSLHSNNQDIDAPESIARLRRLMKEVITEQLLLKKQLRVSSHTASSQFPCQVNSAPPLRRLGGRNYQQHHEVLCLSHCMNVRWKSKSRQGQSCAKHADCSGSNPTTTLHTTAVASLDNDFLLLGRFLSASDGFHLLQLQLKKTFYDCLTVILTPIGPRFSDILSHSNPCEGSNPALSQGASNMLDDSPVHRVSDCRGKSCRNLVTLFPDTLHRFQQKCSVSGSARSSFA